MNSLVKYALGAAVLIVLLMGGGLYWQHTKIRSQAATIAVQKDALDKYAKDKKAQDAADKVQATKYAALQIELKTTKGNLDEALKTAPCTRTALPDDVVSLLNKVYGN